MHLDAVQRQNRLQRLRQELEREEDEQHQRSVSQLPPGTLRSHAWHRPPEEGGVPGARLYRDAEERRARLEALQARRRRQQLCEEFQEATFRPTIEASQRTCRGVGRAMRDPEGVITRSKLERLRELRGVVELVGCTFQPQIDQRSEELMQERLSRMHWTGNPHDALYEDAMRRKERLLEAEKLLPPEATFQPDIGANRSRPPNDDTHEDFVNRLAYSKSYSEKWVAQREQLDGEQQASQDSASQQQFHPQTGRGPLQERNREGLPIGEFLYEVGKEKAIRQAKWEEQLREEAQAAGPRVGEASRLLFEETKRRKYLAVFEGLVRHDAEGLLRCSTLAADEVEEEMWALLRPLLDYLQDSGDALPFDAFCAALDHQRSVAAGPTAHVFVRKVPGRRAEAPAAGTPRGGRPAARTRPKGVSAHEWLHRSGEHRERRLQQQRAAHEEKALRACTFQPNAGGAPRQPCSASARGPREDEGGRAARGAVCSARTRSNSPAGVTRRTSRGGPPGVLIGQLSLFSASQPNSARATPSGADFEDVEPSIGRLCREQLDEVEQAVAHCKSVVARARAATASQP